MNVVIELCMASKMGSSLPQNDDVHPIKECPVEPLNGDYQEMGKEIISRLEAFPNSAQVKKIFY